MIKRIRSSKIIMKIIMAQLLLFIKEDSCIDSSFFLVGRGVISFVFSIRFIIRAEVKIRAKLL